MRRDGQATTEYVALLLVVCALAAVGAVAVPGVGERVARAVRTGVCVVGGDICRGADAAAAGLEPCVMSERSQRQDTTLDVAVVRFGGHGEWQLTLRSDGAAVVTRLEENELGGTVGVGVSFSPVGLNAEASAALMAGYRGGRAWRFADARAAAAFLAAASGDSAVAHARRADTTWHALGGKVDAEAGAALADLARAGLTVATESMLGLRSEGARRTLSLDLGVDEPFLSADLPGFPGAPGVQRAWAVEVSWEDGSLRELALRSAARDGGRLEELAARLDLHDPGNRAVAERLLRLGGPSRADLRALAARIASDGIVERAGYRVSERRRGFGIAGKLGVSLGLEHQRIRSERRLVDAVAWVRGAPPQQRFDCLGV